MDAKPYYTPLNKEMQSLAEERVNPRFPVREMTHFLDGSPEATALKEKFMLDLERDPLWRMDDSANLSLAEVRERTMAKNRSILHYLANEPVHIFRQRMNTISLVDPAYWTRLGVHYGLFFGALQSQATSSQMAFWVSKGALTVNGMYGCFAMTELGHGSYVQGLETISTFDAASDEFIVHTPSITAYWWIGGAAQSATHAAVYAQLIVNGKRHGVKVFVVPLRDPKTFKLLPGITIGDIGKKMGRDGIDNGYIQFTNVRIPRSYMLMKYSKVLRDGTVVDPPMAQLAYGALIQGRVAMVVDSGNTAKKALTIATRYAAIRRQFASPGAADETKLLDYTIHQHRILTLLAQTMAMHFTGVQMDKMYVDLMDKLESARPGDDMAPVLATLKSTHATSAGLKAHCTWATLNIIEQCRQSLGGHGYSSYTELSAMASHWAVQCTWEGDNTILTLQSGRYLVSSYREAVAAAAKAAKTGAKPKPTGIAYLGELPGILSRQCADPLTAPESLTPAVLREAFAVAAATMVHKAALEFEAAYKATKDVEKAYEECAHARFMAAKVHSAGYLFDRFADAVVDDASVPAALRPTLVRLLLLYGAHTVSENAGVFLQSGYLSAAQIGAIQAHVNALLKEVRRDAVPLVDAFNLSDYVVNSPFGRKDGNIYEHYFDQVRRLNPTLKEHPYFESTIKPLLHRSMDEMDAPELDDE
ncbi:fatty-acyl coenzyme A oxidase [Blastocladiella emersonii ATCC 22665]|nr:fatty-acyl coenzyme A oxidase [Blastocladiella emersonii ATCC 22665]